LMLPYCAVELHCRVAHFAACQPSLLCKLPLCNLNCLLLHN
jgi:hypothetical protein